MHRKINIVIWTIALVLAILLGAIFLFSDQVKLYEKTFHYFDTDITVRIYERDQEKVTHAWEKIESIYQDYDHLSDPHKSYDEMVNIHTIRYNKEETEVLTLDERLYQMLEYANEWQEKSNGVLQINQGALIDGWESYLELGESIPSEAKINAWNEADQSVLVLQENNQMKNNHPMLDLGKIPLGFANDEVASYLKEENITQFLIQEGGNANAGLSYKQKPYKVALEILNENDVATIVSIQNKSIVTEVSDLNRYEYDGKTYHLLIDSETSYPASKIEKVTVIANDSKTAYTVSHILYLMDSKEGKEWLENLSDIEALWQDLDGSRITTTGFSQYE